MTNDAKISHINGQIEGLRDEQWRLDSNAKACAKAGLKERAEAIAKQSAETQLLMDAFSEQLAELKPA